MMLLSDWSADLSGLPGALTLLLILAQIGQFYHLFHCAVLNMIKILIITFELRTWGCIHAHFHAKEFYLYTRGQGQTSWSLTL